VGSATPPIPRDHSSSTPQFLGFSCIYADTFNTKRPNSAWWYIWEGHVFSRSAMPLNLHKCIAWFVRDSWVSCWKCANAVWQKLSKYICACRNYGLPNLACFIESECIYLDAAMYITILSWLSNKKYPYFLSINLTASLQYIVCKWTCANNLTILTLPHSTWSNSDQSWSRTLVGGWQYLLSAGTIEVCKTELVKDFIRGWESFQSHQ